MISVTDTSLMQGLEDATERGSLETLKPLSSEFLYINLDGNRFTMKIVFGHQSYDPAELKEAEAKNLLKFTKSGRKIVFHPRALAGSFGCSEIWQCIPEVAIAGNVAKVGATDFTALILRKVWPEDQILFSNSLTKDFLNLVYLRFIRQTGRAQLQADFKSEARIQCSPSKYYVAHKKFPLSDYQIVAERFLSEEVSGALFCDKGTGKTAIAISFVNSLARAHRKEALPLTRETASKALRVLVVCPNQVRTNWEREFKKFSTVSGRTGVLKGPVASRVRVLASILSNSDHLGFTAAVVGYDTLKSDVTLMSSLEWDVVICDESHYFKQSKTQRYKSLLKIRDNSNYRLILTGDPIANTFFDIFSQLEFLYEGASGFVSFTNFKRFYGKFDRGVKDASGHSVEKLVGYDHLPLFKHRLPRLAFSVSKSEAGLNLPEKVNVFYEVEMFPLQRKAYDELAKVLITEIQGVEIIADHVLTKLLRLQQVCSGFLKDPSGNLINVGNSKVKQIEPAINELDPDGKMIIWCCFNHDILAVCDELEALGIKHGHYYQATSEKDRQRYVDLYNRDPEFKVLVASPGSAGEGLNLIGYEPEDDVGTYTQMEIFYSVNWSKTQRAQAEDRAHRRGTKYPIEIRDLVVPDSIDQEIRDRVEAKRESSDEILDVSEILQNVLSINKVFV